MKKSETAKGAWSEGSQAAVPPVSEYKLNTSSLKAEEFLHLSLWCDAVPDERRREEKGRGGRAEVLNSGDRAQPLSFLLSFHLADHRFNREPVG